MNMMVFWINNVIPDSYVVLNLMILFPKDEKQDHSLSLGRTTTVELNRQVNLTKLLNNFDINIVQAGCSVE